MASMFGSAIIAMCASAATAKYNDACNKALDAATRQYGLRQSVDGAEDKTVQYVTTTAQRHSPKAIQEAAAAGFFVVKTAKDKRLFFKIPTFGLCSSMEGQLEPSKYGLLVKWTW